MTMFNANIQAYFQGDPKLLLLDLDGTLVNSIPDLTLATDAMLSALAQPKAGTAKVTNWVGNGIDKLVRRALVSGEETRVKDVTEQELQQARVHFDVAYLQALTQAQVTDAYAGVEAWLEATANIPKVLITNKARIFTEPLIASIGWQKHFQHIICGDDLAEKKPSPLPLLHACTRMHIAPEQALMFGDSRNDIKAAQTAGVASVAVTYGYNYGEPIAQANPNWVVDNLLYTLAES